MANKKINQLVSKTAILSTDLFGIGDATTGQLFKKTIAELQAAIGGAVISVNGLVGTVVLDTDDIQELATPTNKYFTDARARGAISLTVTGNSGSSTYSSGTGVLNVPTYTLAGLGGITASFLSGTSGISYNSTTGVITYSGTVYTDSSIRALLSGGTGITYNSSTGAISYSGTVYTDSSVRALISITTTGTSGASTYNNTTGVINVPEYTLAGLGGISLTSLSGGTGITYNSSTGAISYSGTVYTDASVRTLISASGNISYNSTTGVISTSLTQYTDALARASVSLTTTGTSGASTYNSTTGVLNVPQYQGVITLTTTGTSGAATFSSNTLNIPNYGSALSGYLPLTGGTLTGALTGTTATFGGLLTTNSGTTNNTNAITITSATTAKPHIGSGFGSMFIQNNHYYNGSSYVYDDNTLGGAGITLGEVISFQTAAANANPTTKMTITNDGKIGIGTSLPSQKLHISGTAANNIFLMQDTTGYVINQLTNTGGNFYFAIDSSTGGAFGSGAYFRHLYSNGAYPIVMSTNDVERMRITSTGNVGIGVTPASVSKLQVKVATNINLSIRTAIDVSGAVVIQAIDDTANDNIPLEIRATKSSFSVGNVLIGTATDNGEKLYVSGAIRATGTITANSDITLKKNLLKIENALEKVEQINGYTYEFKEDDSKRHAGVIAQEIQTVLPEIVNKGNDGILGVEYGNISALLIEAIKEQQTQINELKALLNK